MNNMKRQMEEVDGMIDVQLLGKSRDEQARILQDGFRDGMQQTERAFEVMQAIKARLKEIGHPEDETVRSIAEMQGISEAHARKFYAAETVTEFASAMLAASGIPPQG
jgi:hypothetical protein